MDWDGVDGRMPTAREVGEKPNHPRANPLLRAVHPSPRGALPYIKGYNREAGGRGSGGIGFRLPKTPLPYQDHVDFSGAVDAGDYLVLDVGGAAGSGYQVHVAA